MFNWFFDMVAAKSDKRTAKRLAQYARKQKLLTARHNLRAQRKYGKRAARDGVRAPGALKLVA